MAIDGKVLTALKVPTSPADVGVQDFLQMMDVAAALQGLEQEVEKQLSLPEKKEEIAKRLKAAYAEMGKDISEAHLQIAVENYFSGLYQFQEPRKSLGLTFANRYVDRARIGKVYGIPLVAILALTGTGKLAISAAKAAHHRRGEVTAERGVEEAYQQRADLHGDLRRIASSPHAASLPETEKGELEGIINASTEKLNGLNPFFNQFCSAGTADDDITKQNYPEVQRELPSVQSALSVVQGDVEKADGFLKRQQVFLAARQGLDTLIAAVRNEEAKPEVLAERAEGLYASGVASLENRQLEEGKKYLEQLREVKDDIQQFAQLPSRVEQLYASIQGIVKEDVAQQQAEGLYGEARQYVDTVNVDRLRQTIGGLERLEAVLNQAYALIIRDDPGEVSGRWMESEDNPNIKNYYVIVKAVDPQGRQVRFPITNHIRVLTNSGGILIEKGVTEEVSIWGEEVPEGAFEMVKQDKMDDQDVDNNRFAVKERGYLEPRVLFEYRGRPLQRTGQITRWPPLD